MKYNIRTALKEDILRIFDILLPFASEGILLPRTKEEIRDSLQHFYVAEKSGAVCGVVSYHDYGPKLKEIRSLAVCQKEGGRGIGSALVHWLSEHLKQRHPDSRIFVLTYSPDFFKKLGFKEVEKADLPEKIWKDCQNCPNRNHCSETALIIT
jgi:amino-acid N-acetyltransferase